MKQQKFREFYFPLALFAAFILWTAALFFIDVKAIGPEGTKVGFATANGFFHALTGVCMSLYTLTDWLSLIPLAIAGFFALLGLIQWIKRKEIKKVDRDVLLLGGLYAVTILTFLLFEIFPVNFRPVLIEGKPEASYPSSTTLLTSVVMLTAFSEVRLRLKKGVLQNILSFLILAFTTFMVIGRLLSGVHWLTDIIGGALFAFALVTLHHTLLKHIHR